MPRTEMAEALGISRKTLYKHLSRIGQQVAAGESPPSGKGTKTNGGRQVRKPPPGPNTGSFKKGNPGGPGGPPGNEKATKTGEHRNPLLHHMPPEDVRLLEKQEELTAIERLRQSIQVWDARLIDMTRRLAKLQAKRKELMTVEAEYVRQEGDGELSGTYRQAKRKRRRVDDSIIEIHEAITRTQAKRDAAVVKLHELEQAAQGTSKKGLAEVLAAMLGDVTDDDA